MEAKGIGRKALISIAAGLVAGTTNLIAAGAIYRGTLTHGFQMVASGLLGERAFGGGIATAVLGACLHYAISIVAAGLYLWSASRTTALTRYWLMGGIVFGVVAYAVMNLIVVPLSNAAGPDLSPAMIAEELIAHTVMFGIPIAGVVRWLLRSA